MRAHRNAILCIAAVAALTLAAADAAFAQRIFSRGPSANIGVSGPVRGGGYHGGGGYRGGYAGRCFWRTMPGAAPGVIQKIEGGDIDDHAAGPRRPRRRGARFERRAVGQRAAAGARRSGDRDRQFRQRAADRRAATPASPHPHRIADVPADRHHFVPLADSRPPLGRRGGARAAKPTGSSPSVQPNYLFALQQDEAKAVAEGDAAQYELAKLHLPQAHALAKGDNVLVAVIDSGVDANHPELAGAIARNLRHAGGADDAA